MLTAAFDEEYDNVSIPESPLRMSLPDPPLIVSDPYHPIIVHAEEPTPQPNNS